MKLRSKFLNVKLLVMPPKCFGSLFAMTVFFDERGNLKEGVPSFAGITVKPGDMKFKDIAGNDNVIDPNNDKTVIANSDPKHFGGMTNSFTFKNFDLSFMFQC